MSAYIVAPKIMDMIVTHLHCAAMQTKFRAAYYWQRNAPLLPDTEEDAQDLGRALYALNVSAMMQRYPDFSEDDYLEDGAEWSPFAYQYRMSRTVTNVSAYKAMRCLLYQMTEGDVPQTRLYQRLYNHARDLAEKIVCGSPAFDAAPGW